MTVTDYGPPMNVSLDIRNATATQYKAYIIVKDEAGANTLASYSNNSGEFSGVLIDHSNQAVVAILKCLLIIEEATAALSGGTVPPAVQAVIDL